MPSGYYSNSRMDPGEGGRGRQRFLRFFYIIATRYVRVRGERNLRATMSLCGRRYDLWECEHSEISLECLRPECLCLGIVHGIWRAL